jgi:HK97 family phage prohead protease
MRPRAFKADLRAEGGGDTPRKITGHAAVFDSLSLDFGGWKERIAPGAFARSLRDGQDVVALFAHDDREVLGRRSAGTLDVREDQQGLAFEISPPDLEHARKVMVLIQRGDLSGASFAFRTKKDTWGRLDGNWVRTLLDVDLFDISPVTFPAYPGTDLALRGLDVSRERYTALREAEIQMAAAGLATAVATEGVSAGAAAEEAGRLLQVHRAHLTYLAGLSL